jgi:thermitase
MAPPQKPRPRAACLLFVLVALACLQAGWAGATTRHALPSPAAAGPFAPGEAIVRFEEGTSAAERREVRRQAEVGFESTIGLPRTEVVAVEGTVAAAVRQLERQPEVAYAQPNYRYEALAVAAPDDTFFGQLWGLSDPTPPDPGVGALEAWETTKGAGQVIAVVDTGVDLTHPDLQPNLWSNPLEAVGFPGLDEDLNGKVDDLHGYDFVDDDGDPDDYEFHGTHVAGTAAAVAGNSLGIAGVAPEAEIMAVRVLDGDGSGFTSEIAAGIAYAAQNGADVINLSLGGLAGEDEATEDAIELAAANGTVVVAAAGNEGADNDLEPHTPCALPQANLICVAPLDRGGGLSSFSNYGPTSVDLAAPGRSILSAKTDYGPSAFSDGFEPGLGPWTIATFNGGVAWGTSTAAASGAKSATDSPAGDYGQAIDPSEFAVSEVFTDDPIDLNGERGCRMHYRAMYETEEAFDFFVAGAVDEGTGFDLAFFDGVSFDYPSSFSREESSISDLDGQGDVHPLFAMLSDELVELDGAYVDDIRVLCRDQTYVDDIATGFEYDLPDAGNYVSFNGSSMATPHVAGVVALVRAAAPGLGVQQVVEAVLDGTSPIPVPSATRKVATEGIADACQAIALATGGDIAADCPGSVEWEPIDEGGTVPPLLPVAPDTEVPNPEPRQPALSTDLRRPRAFFRKRPPAAIRTDGRSAKAVFRFDADEAGVSFFCRIDTGRLRPCGARLVRRFAIGQHVVRVRARDGAGNDGPFAVARFRVKQVLR